MSVNSFSFHAWLNDLETNVDEYISHPKHKHEALYFIYRMRNDYGHLFK